MIFPNFLLNELITAPSFQLWPGAVSLASFQPETMFLYKSIEELKQLKIEFRTIQPHIIENYDAETLIKKWQEEKLTIQIRDSALIWPELMQAANELGNVLKLPSDGVSTFWSYANHRGAHPHQDLIYGITVQLTGQKKWAQLDAKTLAIKQEIILNPGDVMVVHPYDWHVCDPLTDCQHISIKFKIPKNSQFKKEI